MNAFVIHIVDVHICRFIRIALSIFMWYSFFVSHINLPPILIRCRSFRFRWMWRLWTTNENTMTKCQCQWKWNNKKIPIAKACALMITWVFWPFYSFSRPLDATELLLEFSNFWIFKRVDSYQSTASIPHKLRWKKKLTTHSFQFSHFESLNSAWIVLFYAIASRR